MRNVFLGGIFLVLRYIFHGEVVLVVLVSNRYSMRPSVLKYTGTSTRASCHACILHKTRGFLMLYVFYIPYLPCNNKNINRKGLYDFYYTAITLTTGYKHGLKVK